MLVRHFYAFVCLGLMVWLALEIFLRSPGAPLFP